MWVFTATQRSCSEMWNRYFVAVIDNMCRLRVRRGELHKRRINHISFSTNVSMIIIMQPYCPMVGQWPRRAVSRSDYLAPTSATWCPSSSSRWFPFIQFAGGDSNVHGLSCIMLMCLDSDVSIIYTI